MEVRQEEYYIYITTNLINKKFYVGQHIVDNSTKDTYLGSGRLFTKSLNKYGRENFNKEILYYAYSKEEANEMEIWYINKLDAKNKNIAYNLAEGGGKVGDCLGKEIMCIETGVIYKSIRFAGRELGISGTNIVSHLKGKTLSVKGLHFKYVNEESPNRIPIYRKEKIYCLETNKVYDNVKHICEELKLNESCVSMTCNRKISTTGGYHLRYENDSNESIKTDTLRKSVTCITDGKTFKSVKEATLYYKLGKDTIKRSLNGKKLPKIGLEFKLTN